MTQNKMNRRTSGHCDNNSSGIGSSSNCEMNAQLMMMIFPDRLRIRSIFILYDSHLSHNIVYEDRLGGGVVSLLLNKTYTLNFMKDTNLYGQIQRWSE